MTESLMTNDQLEQQIDQNRDYLSELVGPDKKFKNEKELAKGKAF